MGLIKKAMIVGVNEYKDKTIPPLEGAERDAAEMKDILKKYGDFEVEHFLTGPDATSDAIRSGISDLLWKTDETAVTLFYFSGHGFQDSYGRGYIAPCDMVKQRPLVHGIEMQELKELALISPNKGAVVLILDCCYAGIAADEKGVGDTLDTAEKCFSEINDLKPAEVTATGVYVFSSSASDQTSRELSRCRHKLGSDEPHTHGAFTFSLIEGLNGGATSEEGGLISVATLRKYLHNKLKPSQNQIFKAYGARETNPEGIILARAAKLEQLTSDLATINKLINSGQYHNLILAGNALADVLSESPNYEAAMDLRSQLAEHLVICRGEARDWLIKNKLKLLQQAPEASISQLENSVLNLCVERITEQPEEDDTQLGLLLTLLQIIDNKDNADKLLQYLVEPQRRPESLTPPTKSVDGMRL